MVLNNFTQTNGGLQSGGYSLPDESYYPYSPASISSNGSPVGWPGQNMNPGVYLGEQVQLPINKSPVMTMPISPVQREAPIPTIISTDEDLLCAKVQPATAAPAKQGGKSKKLPGVKRARTAYSSIQLATLEQGFRRDPYVNRNERIYLAQSLHLSEKQIKIWYQNRRMKLKKETLVESGSASKPMRPKKKAATIRAAKCSSRRTSTCSNSTNSQMTNLASTFDAHRASMITPPDEIMPMNQVPTTNCVYEDKNNHQRRSEPWIANGATVNVFPPKHQPIQWQNANANYVALQQPTWNSQQFSDVNYDAAYHQGPSTSASSSNNQRSVQEPNIFMENYQLPVLGDLSAWLDNPQDQIFDSSFTSL